MNAAILISGYLRSFTINIDSFEKHIFSKFENYDLYIHITKDEKNQDKYLNFQEKNLIDKLTKKLNPKVVLVEDNFHFSSDTNKNSLYNQWFKFYKLNTLKKINEKIRGRYDVVIKLRPDLFFMSDLNFENKNKLQIPLDSKIDLKKLNNINDNYVCDTIAFGNSEIMDDYFSIFEELDSLTTKFGFVSETILYEFLKNKIEYTTTQIDYNIILSECNIFAICGDSGCGKSTLGNILSKHFNSSFLLECDRYHKWERSNEQWEKYTHLNPEANLLTKMNQDIFDLKIGKNVYHVDYDHSCGKFTQKEKIKNSENLIVCGLHSLYNRDKNKLYNLKIFMDTEESLKYKWKIKRDSENRNYTKEQIINQLERRKNDYKLYIEPQKINSDIIINFYEYDDNLLGLRIKIITELINSEILKSIQDVLPISCVKFDNKFITLDFHNYIDLPVLNEMKFRNFDFYDYITYIIIKLNGNL